MSLYNLKFYAEIIVVGTWVKSNPLVVNKIFLVIFSILFVRFYS